MRCEDIEQKLLTGSALTPEERRHLDGCAACQEYRRLVAWAGGDSVAEPSAALDRSVLGVARRELSGVRRRRQWRRGLGALSAAACVALLVGLWCASQTSLSFSEGVPGLASREVSPGSVPEDGLPSVLSAEDAELSALEAELGLLSTVSLELDEGVVEESLADVPVSELSAMNDELLAMEQMFKEL